jgi:hypothetical protein
MSPVETPTAYCCSGRYPCIVKIITKHTNILCDKNSEYLNVKAGGTCSNCYALNFELDNSVELCPSWEGGSRCATQELPNILWKPMLHYLIPKSPALDPYPAPDESSSYLHKLFL